MMRLERTTAFRYPRDVDLLIETCQQEGYVVSPNDAEWAWGEYCEDVYAAGWMTPQKHQVVNALLRYLHPIEDTL